MPNQVPITLEPIQQFPRNDPCQPTAPCGQLQSKKALLLLQTQQKWFQWTTKRCPRHFNCFYHPPIDFLILSLSLWSPWISHSNDTFAVGTFPNDLNRIVVEMTMLGSTQGSYSNTEWLPCSIWKAWSYPARWHKLTTNFDKSELDLHIFCKLFIPECTAGFLVYLTRRRRQPTMFPCSQRNPDLLRNLWKNSADWVMSPSPPHRFQAFVANLVVGIKQTLRNEIWRQVSAKQIPDVTTRPVDSKRLSRHASSVVRTWLVDFTWPLGSSFSTWNSWYKS